MGKPGNSWFSMDHKPATDGSPGRADVPGRDRDHRGRQGPAGDSDRLPGTGRARCGNRLVVTYNPYEAGCLWLYPEAGVGKSPRPGQRPPERQARASQPPAETGRRGHRASSPMATAASSCRQAIAMQPASRRKRCCWAWATNSNCGASRRTSRRSVRLDRRRRGQRRHARPEAVTGDGRDDCGIADPQPSSGDVDAGTGWPARAQGWQVSGWHVRAWRSCARRARTTWVRQEGCC